MKRLTHKARYEARYKLNAGVKPWEAYDRLGAYEEIDLEPDHIQALKERDTPKEPEQFDGHWYKCPACGKYVGGLKGNFCHMCGQRLKQREEQE